MPRHVAAVYMKSPGTYGVLVTESECPVSLRVVSEYLLFPPLVRRPGAPRLAAR